MPSNELPPDMLRIVIDTTLPVPATQTLDMAQAVIADLRSLEGITDDTVMIIERLGRGSTLLEVVFSGLAATAAVGTFAVMLAGYLQEGKGKAGAQIRQTINVYGGTAVVISARNLDEPIVIESAKIRVTHEAMGNASAHASAAEIASVTPSARIRPADATHTLTSGPATAEQPADTDWVEILGRFVSAFDGSFRLFRHQGQQYRLAGPAEVLSKIPEDRDVVVMAQVANDGSLRLTDWRPQDALPNADARRALLRGSMLMTTNGTFFTARDGAVYRVGSSTDLEGNFDDVTVLADFTSDTDAEGHQIIQVTRRLSGLNADS